MALNPLIINKNYFSGVQARGDFIKAGDIDRQFVTISNYINKNIFNVFYLTSDTVRLS